MSSGMLFGMPFYACKVDPSSYNKTEIIESIEKNYSMSSLRNKWDNLSNFHHSYNDENNQDFVKINYDSLIPVYSKIVNEFVDSLHLLKPVAWKFDVENYTCSKGNQNMSRHNHLPAIFSAIHYVKFDSKQHLGTTFYNSNSYSEYLNGLSFGDNLKTSGENLRTRELFNSESIANSWLYPRWNFDVTEDDFIIVPSLLSHSVEYVNTTPSNDCRITIALNIYLEELEEER